MKWQYRNFSKFIPMKRRDFISVILPEAVSVQAISTGIVYEEKNPTVPPYLQKADTIGVTGPAGYTTLKELSPPWSYWKIKTHRVIVFYYFFQNTRKIIMI